MKSLFVRILAWLLATSAVAVVGFVIVSVIVASAGVRAHAPVLRPLHFLGGEAVHAYEEGGSTALTEVLAHIDTAYDFHGVLTDAGGHSLSGTDENYAYLVERARNRLVFADTARQVLVFSARIQGRRGPYWFFLQAPLMRFGFWFRVRQTLSLPHLWVLACVILLSYALARHITRPVLELRAAAERLGQGDFGARVRSTRQDELGELARTFDGMAERVEHAVTAQRQLLQDVSHELRSPLSRLGVAVELARTSPNPSEALDRVSREAERLNELVSELLSMTREEPRLSQVNLAKMLAEVVDEAQIEAEARRRCVVLEAAPDIELAADPKLLRRAVENVTRNAVHYTAPETEVRVSAAQLDGQIEITVQDAGPGVPEESLPRLFDAFYRVERDRDRSTGGVGLGLSIARRAIELHGGSIAAVNAHPGLRVVMSLPASRVIMKKA